MHDVDSNNVVVELGDHIHRVRKFLSFYLEVHFIDPDGVHCIPGSGDTALHVGYLPRFL